MSRQAARDELTGATGTWACVALLALLVVFTLAGANAGYLLFALPCMLMMGVMMWMMMGGMGGGTRGGDHE